MISGLLAERIAELFLIMLVGAFVTKIGMVRLEDSRILSTLCLYVFVPCAIFNAFMVDPTPEVLKGLAAAALFAVFEHMFFIVGAGVAGRIFHLSQMERTALIYTNCGNLIIPLVASILGQDYVVYISGYLIVFHALLWTHCITQFAGREQVSVRHFTKNPNLIAIFTGLIILIVRTRVDFALPVIFDNVISSLGGLIGPISMLITGITLGASDLKKLFSNAHLYVVLLLRMIIMPALLLVVIAVFRLKSILPNAGTVFLISFLSAAAPTASTINQFAVVYNRDADRAAALVMLTTLFCIVTMPVMIWFYQII